MTAGREKEDRRAFRDHMVRRVQRAIAVRPERPVQLARRGLPVIPGRLVPPARLVYRDRWVQLGLPALQVRPVRLARVANKAFKGCRAYRGLLV